MNFLKSHPFAVQAHFKSSLVLTFSVPKEELEDKIPDCLELDCFEDKLAFIAVALVDTTQLRPKGFPKWLGSSFFLIGCRIFVRYRSNVGNSLRGLYILNSETDQKRMELLGNIFTRYKYTTTDIVQSNLKETKKISSKQSKFEIEVSKEEKKVELPINSPFSTWKDARKFAGPLPNTFSYNSEKKEVLIIQGVRKNWRPKPINIIRYNFDFLEQFHFKEMRFASAFEIKDIPYEWRKGRIEKWN